MDLSTEFASNYLKAIDLKGRTVRVKIDRVQPEEIGRQKDRKLVLYFVGKEKGMVLNKTNATTLMGAFGTESDDWRDMEIELFSMMVSDLQGKPVPGLRLSIPPQGKQQRQAAPATTPPRPQRDDFLQPPPPNGNGAQRASTLGDDDIPF